MKLPEIRRERLRELMKKHTAVGLSEMLGYRQPSFLSQMAGPNPTREITEKTARSFEQKLGLPVGHLDQMDEVVSAPAQMSDVANTDLVCEVIALVGTICADEGVTLPTSKFADVAVFAYRDTMEHGQRPRPEYIKQVVRLLK